QWSVIPDPNPTSVYHQLEAIGVSPSGITQAVGYYTGASHQTLAMLYPTDPCMTPTATVTPCPINFTDVYPTDYFYEPVRYLYCEGVISGYADNTFRPYNNTTSGQLTKLVRLA